MNSQEWGGRDDQQWAVSNTMASLEEDGTRLVQSFCMHSMSSTFQWLHILPLETIKTRPTMGNDQNGRRRRGSELWVRQQSHWKSIEWVQWFSNSKQRQPVLKQTDSTHQWHHILLTVSGVRKMNIRVYDCVKNDRIQKISTLLYISKKN